jgi:type IV secretory pathway TraG/TraD family ATPase VirD4
VVAWWFSFNQPVTQVVKKLVRGRGEPVDLAESKAGALELGRDDPGINWGGLRIPSRFATSHFMVVGATGSGKTLTLKLLMQEVLPSIGSGVDHRALIYDAKQDIISQLPGMGIAGAVYTINPFDDRCVAWDMAKDITEPTAALQAAVTLIPSDKNSAQPFFVDSAQLLLYGVILSFMRSGANWRFSDIIRALQTVDRLKRVLERCPETSHIVERFYHNRETLDEVMSTVATKLTPYEAIAAMWDVAHEQGSTISLNEWVSHRGHENSVLILGNNERARAALDRINQVVFKRVSELLLDLPEDRSESRRSWIFLDELAEAGRLEGLPSLLTKGRSKGVCVVIGFQDFDSLKEVYGENTANALTSQCNSKAILRLESPATAKWASSLFGEYESIEVRVGESVSKGYGMSGETSTRTQTRTEEYAKRQALLESQLYGIPPTGPQTGLTGYYLVPGVGAYTHTYPGKWLFEQGLSPVSESIDDFTLRPVDHQWLRTWLEEDAVGRGLVEPMKEPSREPTDSDINETSVESDEEPDLSDRIRSFRQRQTQQEGDPE